MSWADMVSDARKGRGPLRHARTILKGILSIRMPVFRPLAGALYAERELRHTLWPLFLKIIYREPLMRYRCDHIGRSLYLEGAIPQIYGNGSIRVGDNVRIGGRNSWTVGFKVSDGAELVIGNRVNIGYQNQISVAKRVTIGDDTMFAPNVQIYDNPNHPLSPAARLRHEQFAIEDAEPVSIGRNVWIGSGALIMRGVTIGDGAVIGAMSVVTRDVEPATLVAGNPARVLRDIADPTTAGHLLDPSVVDRDAG
jgi:acetyltransferase-like isoleucine patch superfamily enzyme